MIHYDYEGPAFAACDANGRRYLLTPLYRYDGEEERTTKTFSLKNCIGLRTAVWQWVARDARGRYRITDTDPQIELISDDPAAI
jgi:hypothetical protein